MDKRRQWIMDNKTLNQFESYRQQKYKAIGQKQQINDNLITQYYTYIIIYSIRKKVSANESAFTFQKIVHTAVCLFKRFYLANQYGDGEQEQVALCCLYLAYKINQVSQKDILIAAEHERVKATSQHFKASIHYGEDGYNQKQLYVLRGIGFQIGCSPMISSIQSLVKLIQSKISHTDLYLQIHKQIFQIIRRVYIHPRILFLYQGPKIGISLVLFVLKKMKILQKQNLKLEEIFGQQIPKVVQIHKKQILQIEALLATLEKFDHSSKKQTILELIRKVMPKQKKTYDHPVKSPKSNPVHYQFPKN